VGTKKPGEFPGFRNRPVDGRGSVGIGSDAGGLAGLAEALEFFAATALAGLLVISLASHLFPEAAALAELAEAADGFLDRLAGTDP